MAKTRDAENKTCPLCGESFAQDTAGQGYVKHLARPRSAAIFDDTELVSRMLESGEVTPGFRDYFNRTGLCPYQREQRD
jgi:hypothetical protein